jgi:hypothetical protein
VVKILFIRALGLLAPAGYWLLAAGCWLLATEELYIH